MELGLSLGDPSNTVGFLKLDSKSTAQDPKPTKMSGLNFCMALGLKSTPASEKAQEIDGDDDDQISQGDDESDDNHQGKNPMLQLNLLPLVPVNPRRQIASHLQSLPWSSDNGSSENGSSGRRVGVNRLPAAAAEEVSSANSVGLPLIHMDFGMYRNNNNNTGINEHDLQLMGGGNKKRSSTEFDDDENTLNDDDENTLNARKKLRLSKQQSAFLEESFKEHHTLNPKQKLALARQLNLRPRQVEVWFQNRRARTKLKQTEVDCEYLKRCCETLTEDNRRLHKELQELRALKNSNPFYMQPPATTLTMCPSCERVAVSANPTTTGVNSNPKAITFPLSTPKFHPFHQTPTRSNSNTAS
ncbi:hypothetical protein CASFOL_033837 [Castilleja foliolosa]|uniref:Homeobox domain-containing protein n=1 Tax=Castilleja foliolosa TaxID=1961234 RepID=A0ABD3BZ83_9LAMI